MKLNNTKFLGNQAPEDIWSPANIRFGKDLSFKRINTQANWIIHKPDLALVVKGIANNLVTKFNNTTTVVIIALSKYE